MTLVQFHILLAYFVIGLNLISGLWSIGAHFNKFPNLYLWRFTSVAQTLIVVQLIVGVVLFQQVQQFQELHMFYSFVSLLVVALLFSYKSQLFNKEYLLYGGGGLFIAGLLIRIYFISPI